MSSFTRALQDLFWPRHHRGTDLDAIIDDHYQLSKAAFTLATALKATNGVAMRITRRRFGLLSDSGSGASGAGVVKATRRRE